MERWKNWPIPTYWRQVKILLDENMPESLVGALNDLGHEVDSVNRLKLKGLDNGTLYRQVAVDYDLCFTRDAGFVHNVRQMRDPSRVKVLRVVVPQQRIEAFVPRVCRCFSKVRLVALLEWRRLAPSSPNMSAIGRFFSGIISLSWRQ